MPKIINAIKKSRISWKFGIFCIQNRFDSLHIITFLAFTLKGLQAGFR